MAVDGPATPLHAEEDSNGSNPRLLNMKHV
jgi:hypothetical protein